MTLIQNSNYYVAYVLIAVFRQNRQLQGRASSGGGRDPYERVAERDHRRHVFTGPTSPRGADQRMADQLPYDQRRNFQDTGYGNFPSPQETVHLNGSRKSAYGQSRP